MLLAGPRRSPDRSVDRRAADQQSEAEHDRQGRDEEDLRRKGDLLNAGMSLDQWPPREEPGEADSDADQDKPYQALFIPPRHDLPPPVILGRYQASIVIGNMR